MAEMDVEKQVSIRVCLSYGLLYLPLALFAITFYVYVPKFYSDVVGLPLQTISLVILCSRIWDAAIDPGMGYLSDNTTSAWGRRKPWIAAAGIPLAVSFAALLIPSWRPELLSETIWFAASTMLFFLFWTMVSVPYEAFGAEITFSYHQKTRLLGFRDAAGIIGTLLAGVFPFVLGPSGFGLDEAEMFPILAGGYSCLLLAGLVLCVLGVSERQWPTAQRQGSGLKAVVVEVLGNRPFRILLLSYTISAFGAGLPATLIPYYVEYVLGGKDFSLFLCEYFLIGFLCLPFWVYLARKIGKKESWITAMLVNTGAFVGVFFLGDGDISQYAVLVGLSAVGYGATLALPSSMQTDVIDFDEMQYGSRREGQFIGFWSIAKKLAAALGAGAALWVLSVSGYQPNVEQNESTLLALRFLYAGVPSLCNFVAIVIAWRYPIDEAMHKEIRDTIDARTAVVSN